jgi:hypothetical protein
MWRDAMRCECGVGSLAWWLVRGEAKGGEGGVRGTGYCYRWCWCWCWSAGGSADAARLRWLAFRGSCRTLACCHATSCHAMRCGAADCLCMEEVIVLRLVWRSWAAVWLCWAVLIMSCIEEDGWVSRSGLVGCVLGCSGMYGRGLCFVVHTCPGDGRASVFISM